MIYSALIPMKNVLNILKRFESMNKNENAWTMAELVVALMILSILMVLSIQTIKPRILSATPYIYAAVKNLTDAAKYVLVDKNTNKLPDGPVDIPVADSNETCVIMAEALSLISDYNCVRSFNAAPAESEGAVGSPNFQTANLISYSGLQKDFTPTFRGAASSIAPCMTTAVGMKDIMIDINGDSGKNKVGEDQFPAKLLDTGEVIPGTCSNISPGGTPSECAGSSFDNPTFTKHPGCGSNTTVFINEKTPFAYTVYRSRPVTDAEIASGNYRYDDRITEVLRIDDESKIEISFAEADCLARGNVLTRTQCASLGYEPASQCLEDSTFCIVRQSKPLSSSLFAVSF